MTEIADFLRARYAEDADAVRANWHGTGITSERYHGTPIDPVRLLADLDAKTALVDEIEPPEEPREPETDAELHARFAHPAWEYRTTSGPRKQWDDVDVPPCDDNGEPEPGWECNVDAGRDGWERWDYTEESYWRRRRPDGPRPPRIPRALRILAKPFAGHPDHKGEEWAP